MGVLILDNLNDFLFSVFKCEGAPSVSLNVECSMCLLRCQECKVSIRGASTLQQAPLLCGKNGIGLAHIWPFFIFIFLKSDMLKIARKATSASIWICKPSHTNRMVHILGEVDQSQKIIIQNSSILLRKVSPMLANFILLHWNGEHMKMCLQTHTTSLS